MKLRGAVAASLLLAGWLAASMYAVAPAQVAPGNPRCNGNVAGALERQVRADDRRSPGTSLDDLNDRQQDLDSILQQAQIESDILHNVCSSDELPAVQDQLAGVIAWAYVQEADIAPRRFTLLNCPQTASTAPTALIASAWYAIALTQTGADWSTPPPMGPLVREVIPKVQARARALGLTLPAFPVATEYWRNTIVSAAVGCTPPSP